jgi:serine-type D-Ala-D-Ala carboxypeptidase/endopeptidase
MTLKFLLPLLFLASSPISAAMAQSRTPSPQPPTDIFGAQDAIFAQWMKDNHVPGLVWGTVINGKLVHVKTMGVQDLGNAKRPVTPDTGFRIASMSKAFTGYAILKLRDEGKLRLDDPAWRYIPEIKSWGADITVADLLYHTAGFVTDDPWGDRQQVMPEAEFTKLLKAGVPRTAPRGTRYEYSNLGYAMLGRIITNVSKKDYASYIAADVFKPLGMAATTYENAEVPGANKAIGYRWENDAWSEEPYMKHGAFGSMGGITTSANDYAKWIGHLLSAWPAADGDTKTRQTVRAMQYGGGLAHRRTRPGKEGATCRIVGVYGAGIATTNDCVLGNVLFHGGGFPGYGSHMLLIPDAGVGVFALTNRTYAGPSAPVWDAATALIQGGFVRARGQAISPQLTAGYDTARLIWDNGVTDYVTPFLAMNFSMDRSTENWNRLLTELRAKSGKCDTSTPIIATGNLAGRFTWSCANGKVNGTILLAPTKGVQLQSLGFEVVP